jgi:N-acetylmuramoyl-L-alanine amidase
MANYTLAQGDCLLNIADQYGIYWENIWNHARNAELKNQRNDPNILKPGDIIFIPDKEERQESCSTEETHRFKKKGTPAKLRLRIMEGPTEEETQQEPSRERSEERRPREDRPRQSIPYVLEIDGTLIEGTTNEDGRIECSIPPTASRARLILEPGTPREAKIPIRLGHLNPVSELSGVKQRLANLGFVCGDTTDEATSDLEDAIRAFQEKNGLSVTGEIDQQTRDKLCDLHGS